MTRRTRRQHPGTGSGMRTPMVWHFRTSRYGGVNAEGAGAPSLASQPSGDRPNKAEDNDMAAGSKTRPPGEYIMYVGVSMRRSGGSNWSCFGPCVRSAAFYSSGRESESISRQLSHDHRCPQLRRSWAGYTTSFERQWCSRTGCTPIEDGKFVGSAVSELGCIAMIGNWSAADW